MDSSVERVDGGFILHLTGRFDSFGAVQFDEQADRLDPACPFVVVDLNQVDYISSAAIRSLLKLEKALRKRGGGAVLTGLVPFVAQTLRMTGLLAQFLTASSLDEAVAMGNRFRPGMKTAAAQLVEDRRYEWIRWEDGRSTLEWWGGFKDLSADSLSARQLTKLRFSELGTAFGIGGLGNLAEEAAEVLGSFVSLGRLVGVCPADGHCVSDFLVTDQPSEAHLHIASALGISGTPSLYLEQRNDSALSLAELFAQVLSLRGEWKEAASPVIPFFGVADSEEVVGYHFREKKDIGGRREEQAFCPPGKGIMVLGLLIDEEGIKGDRNSPFSGIGEAVLHKESLADGWTFCCYGLLLRDAVLLKEKGDMEEAVRKLMPLDELQGVIRVGGGTRVKNPALWLYFPAELRPGSEKLLRVGSDGKEPLPEEWEILIRKLYGDAGKVDLKTIHGGFTSKTFQVTSYDREGKRMLPTVLKIGSLELTRREEKAYRDYVEKYIFNNSTMIMGTAVHGEWAGLRYNFLGISGPDSRLYWLTHHYVHRPAEDLIPIFNRVVRDILRPWYGQPQWVVFNPYAEHHPLNNPLKVFAGILENARKVFGISPEEETIRCEEMGVDLPNPYRFLKYHYDEKKDFTCTWYKCIVHGDLNMQNVLLDERENIYVIDYSETGIKNAVTDFARLETILKTEWIPLKGEADLRKVLTFEKALINCASLDEAPAFSDDGADAALGKAFRIIRLLRSYADRVTLFETSMLPYLLALLEWTYPIISFHTVSPLQKKFSLYSAGMICKRILELEKERAAYSAVLRDK